MNNLAIVYQQIIMGDQISCCDAKTQLENTNALTKIGQGYTNKKLQNFTLPPMNAEMRNLIERVESSKYLRGRTKSPSRSKETIMYGKDKQGALYEGETSGDLADGYGTASFLNGSFFQGTFNRGQPTNGIFVFNNNCYYVGDIEKYQASGSGVYQNIENGYYYEGQWKKNLQHGQGTQKYANKDEYNGGFMCGSKFGQGQYKFADGRVYKGSFYNGHSDGHGKLMLPNGDSYDGQWKLGQMHGKGVYKWKNGQKYDGEYVNGVRQNRGKYYFSSGACYDGDWLNGLQEGEGKIIQGYDEVKGRWQGGQKIN